MTFGEHQIRQLGALPDALPSRSLTPPRGLLGAGLDQYVAPTRIEHHLRRSAKDDVACAGIEITKLPPRPPGMSAQQLNQREIPVALVAHISRHGLLAGVHERCKVGRTPAGLPP